MAGIDLSKSLLENTDYLKELSLILSKTPVSEMDSNLIYEVAYATTYLDKMILASDSTPSDLIEVRDVLCAILNSVDYSVVRRSSRSDKHKKLLKHKFSSSKDYTVEASYEIVNSPVLIYLRKHWVSLLLPFLVVLLWVFAPSLKEFFMPNNIGGDGNVTRLLDVASYTVSVSGGLVGIGAFLLCVFLCMKVLLDLLYICFPIFQVFGDHRNMASSAAKASIKDSLNGTSVVYKVVEYDRIKRNKEWLNSMISYMYCHPDTDFVSHDILVSIQKRVSGNSRKKSFYLDMAKIEFLHDEFLKLEEA